jgi:integrase
LRQSPKYPRCLNKRWIYVVYLLALNTGLRAGEIWGLKVKDINLLRKFINIERQLLNKERRLDSTKGKNIRKVPCNSILAEEFKLIIDKRQDRESFVFQSSIGTPYTHSNFRYRYFVKDVKEVNVKQIRYHDLRHTALTLMVESGINLNVVQSIAGHTEIKTTMKYVHLLADSIEDVAEVFSLS